MWLDEDIKTSTKHQWRDGSGFGISVGHYGAEYYYSIKHRHRTAKVLLPDVRIPALRLPMQSFDIPPDLVKKDITTLIQTHWAM